MLRPVSTVQASRAHRVERSGQEVEVLGAHLGIGEHEVGDLDVDCEVLPGGTSRRLSRRLARSGDGSRGDIANRPSVHLPEEHEPSVLEHQDDVAPGRDSIHERSVAGDSSADGYAA